MNAYLVERVSDRLSARFCVFDSEIPSSSSWGSAFWWRTPCDMMTYCCTKYKYLYCMGFPRRLVFGSGAWREREWKRFTDKIDERGRIRTIKNEIIPYLRKVQSDSTVQYLCSTVLYWSSSRWILVNLYCTCTDEGSPKEKEDKTGGRGRWGCVSFHHVFVVFPPQTQRSTEWGGTGRRFAGALRYQEERRRGNVSAPCFLYSPICISHAQRNQGPPRRQKVFFFPSNSPSRPPHRPPCASL